MTTDVNNLVFVGLNSRVAALNQDTGTLVWQWRATTPRNGGYVSLLLLDEARLIVSVNGYTYCLDPKTGELSQGVADPSTVQARRADGGHQQLHGVVRACGGEIRAALTPGWLTSRSHRQRLNGQAPSAMPEVTCPAAACWTRPRSPGGWPSGWDEPPGASRG